MVERSRRGKGKKKLLGSHQRSWLWGRNLVRETLLAGRWPIVELHLADDLPVAQLDEARALAEPLGAKVVVEGRERLQSLAHTAEHQGYLARMGPFPYADAAELGTAKASASSAGALFLILDSIQDPYNFGAILRSAGAFGVSGVFMGSRGQVPVTSMVARSSAGVVNRVPIAQVDDLCEQSKLLGARGVQVIGATEKADRRLVDCDFRRPTALIVGNEGIGIRPELLACCDLLVRIPVAADVDSLNAAAATAVLLYEATRWRQAR